MNAIAGKGSISRFIVSIDNSPFHALMVLNLRDDLDVLSFVSENIAQSSYAVSAPDERGKDYIYLQGRNAGEVADTKKQDTTARGISGEPFPYSGLAVGGVSVRQASIRFSTIGQWSVSMIGGFSGKVHFLVPMFTNNYVEQCVVQCFQN